MPLQVTRIRRNVQAGKMTPHGFVPFRSSVDYDPDDPRLHEPDGGARTDNTGAGRYLQKRKKKTAAKKKTARKTARKAAPRKRTAAPKRKTVRKANPWIAKRSYSGPDASELAAQGYTKLGSGSPPAGAEIVYGPTGSISRGGPGRLDKLYLGRYWRMPATARMANGLLRPRKGKESPRVRKALTRYVRKTNPTGDWARYVFTDSKGTRRVITGKVMADTPTRVTIRSDGGQPGYPRGKIFMVRRDHPDLSIRAPHSPIKNPRRTTTPRGKNKLYLVTIPAPHRLQLTISAQKQSTARAEAAHHIGAPRLPAKSKIKQVRVA
jgi:hypothetical protein